MNDEKNGDGLVVINGEHYFLCDGCNAIDTVIAIFADSLSRF